MMTILRKVVFSSMGVGLGLAALAFSLSSFQDSLPPLLEACSKAPSNMAEMAEFEKTYHPYEPWLGGYVVCILTQFLHQLVMPSSYPSGLIAWFTAVTLALPKIVLMVLEAGRCGIKIRGPLQSPAVIWFLGQLFGYSVIFPLIWIPAFCWCRETPVGNHLLPPSVSSSSSSSSSSLPFLIRPRLVIVFCLLPMLLLTVLAFALDTHNYKWTCVAGLLVGPGLALTAIPVGILAPVPATKDAGSESLDDDYDTDETALQMVNAAMTAYATAAALSFTAWAGVVFIIYENYHFDYSKLLDDLWYNAPNESVQFMVLDCIVLYLSLLTHIAYVCERAVLDTLFLTLLFGPGAGCALSLAQLEMKKSLIFADQQEQENENESTAATAFTAATTTIKAKKEN